MCYNISIEDLATNALIEIIERIGNRSVNFSQLNNYGNTILSNLKKNNINAKLVFNRETTKQFLHDYSDVFTTKESKHDVMITLNNNVSTAYLRSQFRVNIALQLIKEFTSSEAINTLIRM